MTDQDTSPNAETTDDILRNLITVQQKIHSAAQRAGRSADDVRLLPVSKTVTLERLQLAIDAGIRTFGENKVQEAAFKHQALSGENLGWSIIGHLQRNKAKWAAENASEFQALDSVGLAEALDRRLQLTGRGLDVLLQVNTSYEESKYGVHPDKVEQFARDLTSFASLRVRGLMTLAVFSKDVDQVRACFRRLVACREKVRQHLPEARELSMGMSGDYEIAIEEGATVVRVGQAIFGRRLTPNSHYWPSRPALQGAGGVHSDKYPRY